MKKISFGEFLKKYNLLVLLVIFIVVSSILSPNFLKLSNALNMLQQCSIPGIIAIGMTLVITLGGIDLSVGGVAAFSGMITAILVSGGTNIFLSIVAGVVMGGLFGLLTGVLIAKCKLPDFIISMAKTKARNIFDFPSLFFPTRTVILLVGILGAVVILR